MKPALRWMLLAADKASALIRSAIGRLRLHAEGVVLGREVLIQGSPIVQRAPGSTITVGDRTVLCSTSKLTALGVSHPVVLRTLRPGAKLEIGADTGMSGGSICAAISVSIGQRCLIGADVMIADTDFHARAAENRRFNNVPGDIAAAAVRIGDDVFLGSRSCILKGVTIGHGAIVGCGSVVTRDVAAGAIVAGNPATQVGTVSAQATRAAAPAPVYPAHAPH